MDPNSLPSNTTIALLLVVGIALLTVAMHYRRRSETGSDRVSTPARVCLVLLRIAIGWHFLVEGLEKVHTPNWSSEGYLRESSGPLAPMFRDMAGDTLLVQLTVADGPAVSPELVDEWQRYVEAHFDYYYRNKDAASKREAMDKAEKILEEVKSNAIVVVDPKTKAVSPGWLVAAKPYAKKVRVDWVVPPNAPPGTNAPPNLVPMTIADRIKEYEVLKKELAEAEAELPTKGKRALPRWTAAKAEAAKWRADLKQELDQASGDLKAKLDKLLSMDQHHLTKKLEETPTKKLEPAPRSMDWHSQRDLADAGVKWGLVVIGVCLIAGCLTRLAAVAGAVLLLMFFLAMPPLPYLPESPKAEGHYLFINKNIIEMLALLALAAMPTGRWAGVDGLLQFVNPFNWTWKKKPAAVSATMTDQAKQA